ncbi:MAG TPA: glucose-1-phosphate cytidylyltransferase [Phycisphaerae bacterium]|nr:glucose-1-phosphate cytidylyltransferase [Phycisphaerae bacterium]HOI56461.1 glucose-1-phosphate cytidylyltransferase [Phycisphaerae bacterium]
MKVVILAGGLGTRLAEESVVRPKPMVEIGGRPILWHIMKIYAAHGMTDFVICLGYKGYVIKEYFINYTLHSSDVTVDLARGGMTVHRSEAEPWRVTLIDTGEQTNTGGRLKRVADYIGDEPFCMTYGDGVGSVDITALVAFHRRTGKLGTLTAVLPPGRFGSIKLDGAAVTQFCEKPLGDGGWINGGFFVLEPKVLDAIDDDTSSWERDVLTSLAAEGQLAAYPHRGFWLPMDTLRDKNQLEQLWASGQAPWKVW